MAATIRMPQYRIGRDTRQFAIAGLTPDAVPSLTGKYTVSTNVFNMKGRFDDAKTSFSRQSATKQAADAPAPSVIPYGDDGEVSITELEQIAAFAYAGGTDPTAADAILVMRYLYANFDFLRITLDVNANVDLVITDRAAAAPFNSPTQGSLTARCHMIVAVDKTEMMFAREDGNATFNGKITAAYDIATGTFMSVYL